MTGTERRGPDDAYRLLVDGMMEGFARCRMLYDDQGRPDDFQHLEVNPAFARLTGIDDAVGRRVTELLPTIRQEIPELLQIFARVAETGEPAEFDIDFRPLDKWLHISATRPREGEFVAFFYDISELERAAGLARENEERLHRSLAAAGAGTWEWEVATGEKRWSDEIWALYDLDPAVHPASYEGWLASVRPEDRDGFESLLRGAVAKGADLDFEWRVNTRDGSPRWLLSHGSAERDAEGTLIRYRGVVIDVTDRKRAALEMLENEQRYAAIFEHSPIAISLTSMPDGRIVSVNAAYCLLLEGRRDEIVGRTIVELGIASEDQWEGIVQALYAQGAVREQEIRRKKLSGEPMSVTVSLVRVQLGGTEHVLSMIRDVTAQKQAEEAVGESRARLAAALASMTDGVYISDAAGDLVDVNEAFARVNRFASKEECLRTFEAYPDLFEVSLDGAPAPLERWAVPRALSGEARADVEYGIRRKDTGEYWDASYSFAPIRGQDGEIVGSVFVERDISDRKRAEAELRRLNVDLEERVRLRTADLEAANAELESFAYSVSHDLRAPLRHVAVFSGLLEEELGGHESDDVRHFLDRIAQSAAEMSELIDDLLEFSRVGRAEMRAEEVDMRALAEDVIEVLRSDAGGRRVEVSIGELHSAMGDRTLLRQVWANIIGNAFKYTRPRDPAVIDIGSRSEGGRVVYWVRDNGVGFDVQYADRVFHVFERLHRPDEFEGTGIGLANVARILGRHDGRCWAESEMDAGATFFFALPSGYAHDEMEIQT